MAYVAMVVMAYIVGTYIGMVDGDTDPEDLDTDGS